MLMNEERRVERDEGSGSNKGTNVVRVHQGGETDQTDLTGDADRAAGEGREKIKRIV